MKKRICMCMALAVMACAPLFADTHYVVPAGTAGNAPTSPYTSWETAANSVADALEQASANDTILVRKGTYSITASSSLNKSTLAGITIKSYDPDNDGKINRDETIFDGSDLTDESRMFWGNTLTSGITFDGFTFRRSPTGALRFYKSADTSVLNCRFIENATTNVSNDTYANGGAAWLHFCTGTLISNCVFEANLTKSTSREGGALYVSISADDDASACPKVIDCTFRNNSANSGGAISSSNGIDVRNCLLDGNKTFSETGYGGALYITHGGTVSGCTITGAVAGNEPGIYFRGTSKTGTSISNCTFENMTPAGTGTRHAPLTTAVELLVENCTFRNVEKCYAFICTYTGNSNPLTVRGCLFYDIAEGVNVLYCNGTTTGKVDFENCTTYAPGRTIVKFGTESSTEWKNCIFCCTQPATSGNNVQTVTDCYTGADPRFVCAEEGVFRLRSDSPCIDQSSALPWHDGAVDLAGNPRIVGAKADYGCYERQPDDKDFVGTTRLVATAEEKTGDWADAYTDFQAAIDATPDRYRLLVKPGLYRPAETIVISNRFIEVVSCGEDGEPDPANTVIDGQSARRVMLVHWGETSTANSDQKPVNWRQVRLEGLTFKDGLALTNGATATQPFAGNGGGLLLYGRAPSLGYAPSRVVNCRFDGCSAVNGGGAALFGGWLEDCTFTSCTATYGGGACGIEPNIDAAKATDYTTAHSWYSATLTGCTFTGNTAHTAGGGYACGIDKKGRHTYVEGCNFVSNKTDGSAWSCYGSGLSYTYGSLVTNCTFAVNTGAAYGVLEVLDYTHGADLVFSRNVADGGTICGTAPGLLFDRCQVFEPTTQSAAIFGGGTYRSSLVVNGTSKNCIQQYSEIPLVLENCTVVNTNGNGILFNSHKNTVSGWEGMLKNCILWTASGKLIPTDKAIYNTFYATNCCFSSTPDPACGFNVGAGCFVNARPGFVDAENGDWSLRGSTCRDKGMMLDWMTADSIDFAGNPRVVKMGKTLAQDPSALPDLGCYEMQDVPPGMTIIFR